MRENRGRLRGLSFFIALSCLLLPIVARPAPLPTKTIAPNFDLLGINGKQVRLQDLKGQPVVLNFCAFWCDTWKAQWPHLKELADQQDELGFRMVSISVDATRVQEFLNTTNGKTPIPILLDVGAKVSTQYHIVHVPTVIVLDSQGRVCYTAQGYPGNAPILHELRSLQNAKSH